MVLRGDGPWLRFLLVVRCWTSSLSSIDFHGSGWCFGGVPELDVVESLENVVLIENCFSLKKCAL